MIATLVQNRALRRRLVGRSLSFPSQVVAAVLLLVTLAIDGVIVLGPDAPAPAGQESMRQWLAVWRLLGIQPTFVTFGLVEWLANVLMFLPVGFLFAGAVSPRRRSWVVPLAAAMSVTAELFQLLLPDRVSSVYDVLANTLGALLGVLLLVECTRRFSGRP